MRPLFLFKDTRLNFELILARKKYFYKFARHTAQRPGVGHGWVGRHNGKRLLTLFLDSSKSGKFLITVKDQQTVDGCVDMHISQPARERQDGLYSYICVRPLRLLVLP